MSDLPTLVQVLAAMWLFAVVRHRAQVPEAYASVSVHLVPDVADQCASWLVLPGASLGVLCA